MQRVKHRHSNNQKMIIVLTIYCFTNQTKVFTLQTFFKTQTTGNSIDFELMRVKGTVLVMQFILSTKDPFNIFFTIIICALLYKTSIIMLKELVEYLVSSKLLALIYLIYSNECFFSF